MGGLVGGGPKVDEEAVRLQRQQREAAEAERLREEQERLRREQLMRTGGERGSSSLLSRGTQGFSTSGLRSRLGGG